MITKHNLRKFQKGKSFFLSIWKKQQIREENTLAFQVR